MVVQIHPGPQIKKHWLDVNDVDTSKGAVADRRDGWRIVNEVSTPRVRGPAKKKAARKAWTGTMTTKHGLELTRPDRGFDGSEQYVKLPAHVQAVSLFPIGICEGGCVEPGVSYRLVPRIHGNATPPFVFVNGMQFLDIMVHDVDVKAGWFLDSNSLRLSIDSISSLCTGDVSFAIFQTEAGRRLTSSWRGHEFIETVELHVSAHVVGTDSTAMRYGLTVLYSDVRFCPYSYGYKIKLPDLTIRDLVPAVPYGLSHRHDTSRIRTGHKKALRK